MSSTDDIFQTLPLHPISVGDFVAVKCSLHRRDKPRQIAVAVPAFIRIYDIKALEVDVVV
ncbi:hypothetical protein C8R43DRAFT_1123635 [Mycena crocata]|nr:hypothetical protein C8R43DRAFT_1123635 [Mycena crocata]